MRTVAVKAIALYQRLISPLLPPACRYTPTCSHYAAEAVELHGARGVLLALGRLLRCHPFSRGGYDPVPLPKTTRAVAQRRHFIDRRVSAGNPAPNLTQVP